MFQNILVVQVTCSVHYIEKDECVLRANSRADYGDERAIESNPTIPKIMRAEAMEQISAVWRLVTAR